MSKILINLPDKLHDRLTEYKKSTGKYTISGIIEMALQEYLDRDDSIEDMYKKEQEKKK